ncbi:tRNA (adenosine(37)-N6)-threonylcarbamoyltransferase complex transferase subunit TsaD [Candidatus Daviesbacteria bacterium]|nr:tRNA (adenosine(37)-N6)-threonylcarbamoyltransferase complex transferase subunit TsaD [Candidatus Daviesbacteria bacterium]
MIILGIETSCDETAAAVLSFDKAQDKQKRIIILSNVVASSAKLQAKYGGVIPEQAAREQLKTIIPVIEEALNQAFPKKRLPRAAFGRPRNDEIGIDAIAVTFGPGLIGSLLVGVETAKTLARIWDKPLIPVNHLLGHFYANWIVPSSFRVISEESSFSSWKIASSSFDKLRTPRNDNFEVPSFPCLGLLVSGGHTDLVLFSNHGKYKYLGGTRDDACGECFDKCARLLGLPYPGGPYLSKLAEKGDSSKFNLPIPMRGSKDLDFSYSGLKTAVANIIQKSKIKNQNEKADLAAAIEETIIISLIEKVILAIKKYKVEQIMVAGGVAANQKLVRDLRLKIKDLRIKLHVPPPYLCTDNGAMIAAAGFFTKPISNPLSLQADPNLSLL